MTPDVLHELLRLARATPPDAPLRQAYLAGRLRRDLPDAVLAAAARDYLERHAAPETAPTR